MKRRKKWRGTEGICVYCGKQAVLEPDHVPPKNLFIGSQIDDQLITVPACERCNRQAAKDDEYFRLTLVVRADVSEHPQVIRLLPIVMRSLARKEGVGFSRSIGKSLRRVNAVTKSGILLGPQPGIDVSLNRLNNVAKRIIKGLFYRERGFRLPDTHIADAFQESGIRLDRDGWSELQRMASIAMQSPPKTIAGVFEYWFANVDDDPNSIFGVLRFFGRVVFIGWTGPKHLAPKGHSGI